MPAKSTPDAGEPELRLLVTFAALEGSPNTLELVAQPVTAKPGEGGALRC